MIGLFLHLGADPGESPPRPHAIPGGHDCAGHHRQSHRECSRPAHEFNEVVFDDMFVPFEHALGDIDMAWKQATSELAYERSGPERFLETSLHAI